MDKFAPKKTTNPHKSTPPWINTELRLLKSKRDATGHRCHRTGLGQLNQFIDLANATEEKSKTAHCDYMHNCIDAVLDGGKNFCMEIPKMGLRPMMPSKALRQRN